MGDFELSNVEKMTKLFIPIVRRKCAAIEGLFSLPDVMGGFEKDVMISK